MDMTATILASTATTPTRPLDGIDLVPILSGRAPGASRDLYWRTDCWKVGPQRAERAGKWKYLRIGDVEHLYDLDSDPNERDDLSALHLDIVATMRASLAQWEAEMDASPRVIDIRCGDR
jgi:arylsulfatase A-like enzyme